MGVYENRGQLGNVADRTNRVHFDNSGARALIREKGETANSVVQGAAKVYAARERQKEWERQEAERQRKEAQRQAAIAQKEEEKREAEAQRQAAIAQKQEDARVAAGASRLNGEYTVRTQELMGKLLSNKGDAARDNLKLYEEGRQKIEDEIVKNSGAETDTAIINAFRSINSKDDVGNLKRLAKYGAEQREAGYDAELANQKTNMVNDVSANYGDDDVLASNISRGRVLIGARYGEFGDARVQQECGKWASDVLESATIAAMNDGNFERANDLLTGESGDYLDPKVRERLQKDFEGRVLTHKTTEGVKGLFVETEGNYALMRSRFEKELLSPNKEEQEKQWKMFDNQFESLRRQARNSFDTQYDKTRQGIRAMVNGNMDYAALQAECEKAAGGDQKKAEQYKKIADRELAKGGAGLSKEGMSSALRFILNKTDDIRNKEYLLELLHDGDTCQRLFGGAPSKEQIKMLEQEYSDFTNNRGPYKFDWNGAMAQVMASREVLDVTKDMDKAQVPVLKSVLETMGQEFVRRYLQDKSHIGEMPSFDTVVRYCKDAAVRKSQGVYETHWFRPDDTVNVSEAEKWRMGIRNITRTQDGKFRVTYLDGNEPPRDFDGEDLMNEIKLAGGRKAE